MKNKAKSVLSLILIIGLSLVGCQDNKKDKQKDNLVKVGGLFSLSGGASAYGEDLKNGTLLAFDELNANKQKYQLLLRDTKTEKNEAVKSFEDLVNMNKAEVILGPTISPNALILGKYADQYKIPLIVQAATQDEITDGRKYVSRICFNDSFQGKALADFALNDLKKVKAVVIYDKSISYSVGLAKSFVENYKKNGGEIISEESYSVKDRDFRSLIDKVSTYDADILFIPGWDENVGPMLRQSGDKWDKFVILGGDGFPTDKMFELSGKNLKNVYALGHFNPVSDDSKVKAFIKKYAEKYKKNPTPHGALGYDAVYVLDKVVNSIKGDVTPEKINKGLKALHSIDLITGKVIFKPDGTVQKNGVILKLTPEGYEFVKIAKAQ